MPQETVPAAGPGGESNGTPAPGPTRVLALVVRGLDENSRRVLDLVRESAPCHRSPILEAVEAVLGLSRSTTQSTLRRLEDYGLLSTRRRGRCVL